MLRTFLQMRESKPQCAGQSLGVPRAGASGTDASVRACVHVCVCVCETWVCEPVPETLGLWDQTHLRSIPPLALPLGFGFLFCDSKNRVVLLPHSRVGRIKWIKTTSLEAQQ